MRAVRRQIAQLDAIPGFGVTTAQDIITETDVDMTVFSTAGHLCSWARQAPQVSQSADKRKGKNATGRGNPYIDAALGESAIGAGRTQTFLGAKPGSTDAFSGLSVFKQVSALIGAVGGCTW